MGDKAVGVVLAIIGLASLSVIISKRSNTAKVLQAFFAGLNSSIRGAVSPVTGK